MSSYKTDSNDEVIKIILVGESGVGKTSIINKYLLDTFNGEVDSSFTVGFVEKAIEINNKQIKLNIWDTAGQEKYRSVNKLFVKEAKIAILVYDITNHKSFEELDYWYNFVKNEIDYEIILGLAGNKFDLVGNEKVTDEEGKEYADKCGAYFSLLSAKNDKEGIDSFMITLIKQHLGIEDNIITSTHSSGQHALNATGRSRHQSIMINKKNNQEVKKSHRCCGGGESKKKSAKTINREERINSLANNYNNQIKMIFLGSIGVGKTSLIRAINKREFNTSIRHTLTITSLQIVHSISSRNIYLTILDTNGEDDKRGEYRETLKDCKIFFLVFDITNRKSFNDLRFWIDEITSLAKKSKITHSLMVLVGNKSDLVQNTNDKSCVTKEEAEKLANKIGGYYMITSPKENKGIQNLIGDSMDNYLFYK